MTQEIDIVAVSNQIANLKLQRSMAMDDVAVLMGHVESLKLQLNEAKTQLEKFLHPQTLTHDETANNETASS